jgi:hypothetical protein
MKENLGSELLRFELAASNIVSNLRLIDKV